MIGMYTLDDDGEPVGEPNTKKWGQWMQTADRRLADDRYVDVDGSLIRVSTVFLGLDHAISPDQPPILYETMIFGGEHDGERWRASTAAAARLNHRAALELLGIEVKAE